MDSSQALLEILRYTIPALIVLAASYFIIDKFLVSETKRKQMAIFKEGQDITLRLRLQAYERLALFVERINPRLLIPRIYEPSMTVSELQYAISVNIRAEYEHNLSQQIYVSQNVWQTVKNVKEQELMMVNKVAQTLKPDAPAKELNTRILDMVAQTDEELPTNVALNVINEEVKMVLSYGSI